VADVVRAVMFVLRDAPYMTGSVLRLDGGFVLGGSRVAPMPNGVETPTADFKSQI
jgi:3-oxoacyl-[acyl-carrier protein] reductase